MQGWAKGLKERVERTATQISQTSNAFLTVEETKNGLSTDNKDAQQQSGSESTSQEHSFAANGTGLRHDVSMQ